MVYSQEYLVGLDQDEILEVKNNIQPKWFTHAIAQVTSYPHVPVNNNIQPKWFTHLQPAIAKTHTTPQYNKTKRIF